MVISISGDLNKLGSILMEQGYEIHNINEGIKSDAYIYSNNSQNLMQLNNSIVSQTESFIINADNKSTDEILFALNHRVYSPLF